MCKIKVYSMITMLLFAVCATAQQSALPKPPSGYSWEWCEEIKGAFLKPDGWFFKKGSKGDTLGFFITKEDLAKEGGFKTGLTVNVIPRIPAKKKISAYEFTRQFRDEARKSVKFIKEWDRDMGPFRSVGFLYEKGDRGGAFKVHSLLISNDGTGTVYLVTFEAPGEDWETAWKTAEPIIKQLYIDDTI